MMTEATGPLTSFDGAQILVVDDNVANTSLLEQVLRLSNPGLVRTCNDSREIPSLLAQYRFDLVLLDLHMPHVDGFEALEMIGRHAAGEFLPVIVVTADTTRDAVHRALRLGAHDFLTKPFDIMEVSLRVGNLLRTRSAYWELRRERSRLRDHLDVLLDGTREAEDAWETRRDRIEKVIANGGPRMVFQPVVDLRDGRTLGYEALARFDDESMRGPDRWFAEADSVGLGRELEVQAVRNALASLPLMKDGELMGVNLSPATLVTAWSDDLGSEIPWGQMVIELTEHVAIEDYLAIQRALHSLRERGARVTVDDTGAGFSSLRHILNLDPDFVKLDISLCQGIDHDPARRALAAALVAFTNETKSVLVAEGIETTGELATLRSLDVQYGQGYLLGRPGPLPDDEARSR